MNITGLPESGRVSIKRDPERHEIRLTFLESDRLALAPKIEGYRCVWVNRVARTVTYVFRAERTSEIGEAKPGRFPVHRPGLMGGAA